MMFDDIKSWLSILGELGPAAGVVALGVLGWLLRVVIKGELVPRVYHEAIIALFRKEQETSRLALDGLERAVAAAETAITLLQRQRRGP